MEQNPYEPRQRNRRSQRAEEPSPWEAAPQQAPPAWGQPPQQQPHRPQVQQPYQQVQQPPYQPYQHTVQQPYARPQQQVPPASPVQPQRQYPPRTEQPHPMQPRQLPQRRADSGWSMPDIRREQPAPAAQKDAPADKLPGWLSTSLCVGLVVVMALVAALALMWKDLTDQEQKRIDAYHAMLANYHVTEHEDGSRTVTWQDLIEKYATAYNLQPAFVTAVIRNESSFRTNAESSVGARGLMQLMPSTAEWIAGKLDDYSYTFDRMWEAEANIRYGCWYLGYLSELFAGDPVLMACAFHAGQGEVRSWLGDASISPDGRTVPIDNIPISETKTYAGRVTQAYGIYQALLYPVYVPDAISDVLPAAGR